jgi:DNA-binding transcriptional ArsR family regulator
MWLARARPRAGAERVPGEIDHDDPPVGADAAGRGNRRSVPQHVLERPVERATDERRGGLARLEKQRDALGDELRLTGREKGQEARERRVSTRRVGSGVVRGRDDPNRVDGRSDVVTGDARGGGEHRDRDVGEVDAFDRLSRRRRRRTQRRWVELGQHRLGDRPAAGVGLSGGEAGDGRAQPGHRADRAGSARRRDGVGGVGEQHAVDDKAAKLRPAPKRHGRTLARMTDLADVAAALADRTRARMLEELLAGPPLPAGALAARVGVAPSTVSGHLVRLESAGLVTIQANGRRREARLAGPHVAEALEALSRIAGDTTRPIGLTAVNAKEALREARSCYDHLAGRAGVALADQLLEHGALVERDGAFQVPREAHGHYKDRFGVDPEALDGRRPLARACADWTERRPHLAGALGAALLEAMLDRRWVERRPDGRALNVTARGRGALAP